MSKLVQDRFGLQTGSEFNLAKLHRLKTAGRVELVAESQKVNRLHRLEYMDLLNQEFFDLDHAAQRVRRFSRRVLFHQSDGCVDFVQNLLEPKFIRLVHGDEKQFVVMRRRRQTRLQLDQFRHTEVFVVRKGRVLAVIVGHKVLLVRKAGRFANSARLCQVPLAMNDGHHERVGQTVTD